MADKQGQADSESKNLDTEATDEQMSRYWDEAVASHGDSDSDERQSVSYSESGEGKQAPKQESAPEPEPTPGNADADGGVEPQEDGDDVEEGGEEGDTGEDAENEAPEDPWEGVPDKLKYEFEELKKQKDKYEHSARSSNGRLGALQKKIDDLSRKLEEASSSKDGKAESPGKDTGDTLFDAPEWAKFKEDFGEVAIPIEAAIRRSYQDLHSRLENTATAVKSQEEYRQSEENYKQALKLQERRPNWLEFAKDNFQDLEEFANSRKKLKAIWDENWQEITNADEMDDLLTLFEIHAKNSNGSAESKPASIEAKPNNEPRPMTPKRKQQLKSAASPAPRSHPSPGSRSDGLPDSDDPDVLWNWAVNLPR